MKFIVGLIIFVFALEFMFLSLLTILYVYEQMQKFRTKRIVAKQCDHRDDYGLHYATEAHSQINCPRCGALL